MSLLTAHRSLLTAHCSLEFDLPQFTADVILRACEQKRQGAGLPLR